MKVLVADSLAQQGVEILKKEGIEVDVEPKITPEELLKQIGSYEGLLVRSRTKVTAEVIKQAQKLKAIGRAGVGLDNVDVETATEKGIIVMNAPEGNTISAAEHTISLLLALSRNIPQAHASLQEKKWERKKFMGVEVYGKVLGVIGLGRIGTEVCRRARGLGMQVVGYDPFVPEESARELAAELAELDDLLARADYITVHTPLTDDTRHIISADSIAKMKDGVRIINVARGGVVDEAALAQAVRDGKVKGAALDVFEKEPPGDSPLLGLEGVIVTPHLGASTKEAQVSVAVEVAHQMVDVLKTGSARNAVNLPVSGPEVARGMQSYLELAEKLGKLQGQLSGGNVARVELVASGESLPSNLRLLASAVMKGFLENWLEETVNYVNAPLLARRRGIQVVESRSSDTGDFSIMLTVRVKSGEKDFTVAGTLFGKSDPRIVRIGDYRVDIIPRGTVIACSLQDRPGIIGKIGTILGKADINIAAMTLGRMEKGGSELTVFNVDSDVPGEVVGRIEKIEEISEVQVLRF